MVIQLKLRLNGSKQEKKINLQMMSKNLVLFYLTRKNNKLINIYKENREH